ncbi:MAG TPA: TIGR03667 family PPOX class F420-dependent oxidoreductase [Trebonia sp.]|jgi:PPOX class probable F420-dependent enzyme
MAFELTKQIEKHLAGDQIVWLTTITTAGRPAPRPVWFFWNGTDVTIYSQPGAAKVRHLAANGLVSLNFNCTPSGGDVAVISGRAEVIKDAPLPSQVPGVIDKYRAMITAMGNAPEWYDSYSVGIRVTPDRAWGFGD